jgi:RNA polymerase sigma-70 factor, ECF subfamily
LPEPLPEILEITLRVRVVLGDSTCAQALAHKDQWQPGTHLKSWMLRIAQNLWFDRRRGKQSWSEPVDIEVAEFLADSDGWEVKEHELALADLLKALDHLSPEHRVLIALVCVDGLTYTEAADILSLPVGTVMSRLARGRLALHDAVMSQQRLRPGQPDIRGTPLGAGAQRATDAPR